MIWTLALFLSLYGFVAICVSVQKHQRTVFGRVKQQSWSARFRVMGTSFIGGSALTCMVFNGWAQGLVVFCGVATVSALVVIIVLTFHPPILAYLSGGSRGSS